MTDIHPTAIIHPDAEIGENVFIGPFCNIGKYARLGNGVQLYSHVVVEGHTTIGADSRIFPFASIGHEPQDLKFNGEQSQLIIGKNNTIREHVTLNPGTEGGGMVTRIGDGCLFMMSSHVAHDCVIGDNVILVNNATLAGHVEVGNWAIIGAYRQSTSSSGSAAMLW